jgi:hypothetical protein
MTAAELRDWPRDVVRLFLEGCRWQHQSGKASQRVNGGQGFAR